MSENQLGAVANLDDNATKWTVCVSQRISVLQI